jgi:hypothetical protein
MPTFLGCIDTFLRSVQLLKAKDQPIDLLASANAFELAVELSLGVVGIAGVVLICIFFVHLLNLVLHSWTHDLVEELQAYPDGKCSCRKCGLIEALLAGSLSFGTSSQIATEKQ